MTPTYEPPSLGEAPREYEPFDADCARALMEEVVTPLNRNWFRGAIMGGTHLPTQGPAILAANHSGNCLPYDAIFLDSMLWARDGYAPERKVRTVFEQALTARWWMRLFGIDNLWRRAGGVDMTYDNFDRLLARGDRVLYFPEGVPGIGKGFQNRYKLQPYHTSFVAMAAKHRLPVHPLYVVNGEWVMPFHFTIKPLDWVFQKVWSVPFFPLPAGLLAIVFPFLWYLALPAKMVVVAGEPIDVVGMLRDEGIHIAEGIPRPALQRVAERIRRDMQGELDRLVPIHGEHPYRFGDLWRHLRRAGGQFWKLLPTGWPIAFVRHERDRVRPTARNRMHRWARDWDLLLFFVPFGWPLLTLARLFRKPPYGYRGMSMAARREKRGDFLWRLAERPLPPREAEFSPLSFRGSAATAEPALHR